MKKGLLLVNLGTPDAPTPEKVRVYLKEFLMDPYVLDIPFPLRWLLVHGAILPKRPKLSAEAYAQVWTPEGSPLLVHHLKLTDKVARRLEASAPGRWAVAAGMRYGQPSLGEAIRKLRSEGVRDITMFALYPQYSLAATESSVVEALRAASAQDPALTLKSLPAFYDSPPFIEAFAAVAREALRGYDYDHLLFSFHGLPERHVKKTDPTGAHCLASGACCDRIVEANRDCYRAQCFATARALAQALSLPRERYTICFQSRLGRTPWIRPFTDELYASLPKKGVRKLAVMCPAFVADCLETLEEIEIRGKRDFVAQGGEDLRLVPSLNSTDLWAAAVAEMVSVSERVSAQAGA